MGRLKDHLCYLAGPMECVADNGEDWRNWITPQLHKMGIGVFNPCDKPIDYAREDQEAKDKFNNLKATGDWDAAQAYCKQIVGVDARMVHLSSFIILNLDKDVHMCGTYVEFTWAVQQRKPTLVHVKQGKKHTPGFVIGMIPSELIFEDWDSLVKYIHHIDSADTVKDLKRWTFFNMDKVYGRTNLCCG